MGIVKISKSNKTETIEAEAPKSKSSDNLLDVLNHAADGFDFDFGRESAGMDDGRLKTEMSLARAIFATIMALAIVIGVLVGIYFVVTNVLDFHFELFAEKNYYTDEFYYSELRSCLILLSAFLIGICLLLTLFINASITGRFKKRYLKKLNIYLYDGLVVFLNILLFVIVGVIYFDIINGLYSDFSTWVKDGSLSSEVNINIINWFKYAVVVIVSLFLSLNSISGIGIVHKKNRFVFEETL